MGRLLGVASMASVIFAAAAVLFGPLSSQAQQTGPTLRVRVGWGEGAPVVNQFFGDPALSPQADRVRVAVGTTIVWALGSDELHTVTFLAGAPAPKYFVYQPEGDDRPPMINPQVAFDTVPTGPWDGTTFLHTELRQPDQEFAVTFGREGTFPYVCLFHQPMTGVVEVVRAGTAGLTTQSALDQYVEGHIPNVHQAQIDEIMAIRSEPVRADGPGGTSLWFVRAGTDWRNGHLDMMAFLPGELAIRQGDTVVWQVDHLQPHTVTFPAVGAHGHDRPSFVLIQFADGTILMPPPPGEPPPPELLARLMDPSLEPRLVLGPGGLRHVPSPAYDGQRLYNSGLIGEHPAIEMPMDKVFALTFNTPGVFHYHCALHEPSGMEGMITVGAR